MQSCFFTEPLREEHEKLEISLAGNSHIISLQMSLWSKYCMKALMWWIEHILHQKRRYPQKKTLEKLISFKGFKLEIESCMQL